jgi:hypothetical protein
LKLSAAALLAAQLKKGHGRAMQPPHRMPGLPLAIIALMGARRAQRELEAPCARVAPFAHAKPAASPLTRRARPRAARAMQPPARMAELVRAPSCSTSAVASTACRRRARV